MPAPFASRGYARLREFPLPPNIAALVEAYEANRKPPPTPVPALQPRDMQVRACKVLLAASKGQGRDCSATPLARRH